MILLILALAAPQQEQKIYRIEKADYAAALKRCREGEALLETDPRAAAEAFDEILSGRPLPKIECRVRVEIRPGEFSEPQDFLPYQFRARARIALAKRTPERAAALLEGAEADLRRSVDAGVASSRPVLDAVRAERARLATPDPEPAFRSEWNELLRRRRYRSAREHVMKNGRFLDEPSRRRCLEETDAECRRSVREALDALGRSLRTSTPASLRALGPAEIEAAFPLPDPAETCVADPELEWARSFRDLLARGARGEDILEGVLDQSARAPGPWPATAAPFAFNLVEARVRQWAAAARDALADERDRLKTVAVDARRRWDTLASAVPADRRAGVPVLATGGPALEKLLAGFPIDLEDAARAASALDATFTSDRPDAALEAVETTLGRLRTEHGARLSRESRQALLSHLLAASLLRRFLSGDAVEQAVAHGDHRAWARELKEVGGPLDLSRFGGKLARALAALGL